MCFHITLSHLLSSIKTANTKFSLFLVHFDRPHPLWTTAALFLSERQFISCVSFGILLIITAGIVHFTVEILALLCGVWAQTSWH